MSQKKPLNPTKPAAGAKQALTKNKAARSVKPALESTRRTRKKPLGQSAREASETLRGTLQTLKPLTLRTSAARSKTIVEMPAESTRAQWIAVGLLVGLVLYAAGVITSWFLWSVA